MDRGEIPGFWYGMSPFLLHDAPREALLECMGTNCIYKWGKSTGRAKKREMSRCCTDCRHSVVLSRRSLEKRDTCGSMMCKLLMSAVSSG